jgi:Ala-tRNA(Pro) deacylase
MLDHDPLNYHPLTNGMTTAISPADLLAFIAATGRQAQVVDMDGLD